MTHESLSIGFDLVTMALTAGYMVKIVVGDSERAQKILHSFGYTSTTPWLPTRRVSLSQLFSAQVAGVKAQLLDEAGGLACDRVTVKQSLARQLVVRKSY